MKFDKFKAVSKIYIDNLKTNHNYVKATAFLFLCVKCMGAIGAAVRGHYSDHILVDSLYLVSFSLFAHVAYKDVKRKLHSQEFLEKKEQANQNYQEYRNLENIYDEKKKLDKMIAPVVEPTDNVNMVQTKTLDNGEQITISTPKPKKNKI